MKKINCGYRDSAYPAAALNSEEESRVHYPSLHLQGKAAKAVSKGYSPGDTIQAVVTLKVVEMVDRVDRSGHNYPGESGPRVEFEVMDIAPEGATEVVEDDEEETASDALKKYKDSKKSD